MRTSWVIMYFVWAASLIITPVFGDDLPSIDHVRQRLREWRQDLVAFRIRYQSGPVDGNWGGRRFREFVMTDTHDYLDIEELFAPGKTPSRKASGGNAEARFTSNYVSLDEGKNWKLASIHDYPRVDSGFGLARQLMPLSVMLDPNSGLWMDEDYFSKNDVKVAAREEIEGESCIVLDVTYMHNGKVSGNGSRMWLAESKNFLIKKLMPNDGPPTGRRDAEYLCTRFEMAEDKWYPSHGLILLPPEQQFFTVVAFDANPQIDASLFRAPSKAGLVARRLQPGPRAPTAPNSSGVASIPDATPRDQMFISLSGLGLLILVLGLSGWWLLNRSG